MVAETVAPPLKAPFPYAGGKSKVAAEVWRRFGDVPNYCEAFFGSGAVLLSRPQEHEWEHRVETVNDLDGLLANFWRAVQADPDAVARWADWPVSENDLHARHSWLIGEKDRIQSRLEGDPDFFDAKVAGWWVWGICLWIGGGWCRAQGPWIVQDGELVDRRVVDSDAAGTKRQLPHLGNAGMGIHRKLPHLGNAGMGIHRKLPHLGNAGMGIHRKLPHLGSAGRGHCDAWREHLTETMQALANRLRRVRVCCGDWSRVLGPTPTVGLGITGVFLDPPYSHAIRDSGLYTTESDCAQDVLAWCKAHGDDPKLRIALCGYAGEHDALADLGWDTFAWKAGGGYGNQSAAGRGRDNAKLERIWFSPNCIGREVTDDEQLTLT